MRKTEMLVVLGTPHRKREPGKESPDGRLKEYAYGRSVAVDVKEELESKGYKVLIDYLEPDLPKQMQSLSVDQERMRELAMRVNFVNELCKQNGKDNVIYVCIHVDAIGNDGNWHDCGGWSCYTTPETTKSDSLAEHLYDAAENSLSDYSTRFLELKKVGVYGKKQQPIRTDTSDGDKDKESNLFVLRRTQCPAVLTENLFQDNKEDVDFLLSDKGRKAIVQLHVEGIIKYIESL